jgi:hypothetical protein
MKGLGKGTDEDIQKIKVLAHNQLGGGINLIFYGNHGESES